VLVGFAAGTATDGPATGLTTGNPGDGRGLTAEVGLGVTVAVATTASVGVPVAVAVAVVELGVTVMVGLGVEVDVAVADGVPATSRQPWLMESRLACLWQSLSPRAYWWMSVLALGWVSQV
jgi:hypothetical protein